MKNSHFWQSWSMCVFFSTKCARPSKVYTFEFLEDSKFFRLWDFQPTLVLKKKLSFLTNLMKLNVNDLAYYPVVLIWLFLNISLSSEVNSKFGSPFLLDGTQKYSGDYHFLVLLVVVALDNLSACNFLWWLVAINSTFCGLWITGEASWKPKIGQSGFTTQLLHTFSGRVRGYRMGEVSCRSSVLQFWQAWGT